MEVSNRERQAASSGFPAMLRQAIDFHQRGHLVQAQALYEGILEMQPRHFNALHLLGIISGQTKNWARAVELFDKAIDADPNQADAYSDRSVALKALKQWDAALASCEQAISIKGDHAEAHCNRGNVLYELKRWDEALASYERAVALRVDYPEAHYNRGVVLEKFGRWDAALGSYERAIGLKADYAVAHCNRGVVLERLKRQGEALASYERAIGLRGDYAQAYCNRGNVLSELKRWDEALASCERAIELKPDFAEAYCNRGNVLRDLKQLEASLVSYDRAITLRSDYVEAYSNRGVVLKELQQLDEALASCERAIGLRDDYAEAYCNCGIVLSELKRWDEALASYERAIELKPDFAEAYCNRGTAFYELNRSDAALADYNQAIMIRPDFTAAFCNRACTLLLRGDFENGWADLEWRWKNEQASNHEKRNFRQPLWLGNESIAGKTILLHSEQGLGDTIQFCRYTRLLVDLGARVILETQYPLQRVLTSLTGVAQVVVRGDTLPAFDYYCPLMSLPLAFKTSLSTVPAHVPYLRSDADKVLKWKHVLGEKRQFRVGLVWSGGFRPAQPEVWSVNRRRNIPLAKLAALQHPEVEFYSLQKGQPAEAELADLVSQKWSGPRIIDHTKLLKDFSDTAALIEHLDLVISVDTSTAHLAGALGKPVWILNRFDSCWRWLLDRSDSPWYPTARLYRQQDAGDWESVIQKVIADLTQVVSLTSDSSNASTLASEAE